MAVLVPMREETYPSFLERSIATYAEENVLAGRLPPDSARSRSEAEFARLLPLGLATPDNHLYEIVDAEGGTMVGYLWIAIVTTPETSSAFVYNVEVLEPFRRQGHARRAFEELEAVVADLGVSRIGLHVFGHNPGAQALYRALGYSVISMNMSKEIGGSQRGG